MLEGRLSKTTGPASLFIDWFAARGYGGRAFVGGVGYRGGAWHGTWSAHPAGLAAGAALGAAAVGAARAPTIIPTPIPITRLRRAATIPIPPATDGGRVRGKSNSRP